MKKVKLTDVAKKLIYPTSLYYTIITLAFYIIGTMLSLKGQNMIPTLRTVLLILVFSFVLNCANLILTVRKLHISLRVAIHFVLLAVSLFVLFFSAANFDPSRGLIIISFAAFAAVYAVVCTIVFAIRRSIRKSKVESAEYKSIYGKNT